ncbi:uroporphyrinogen-III synthase [Asinibacterium sp. OR53]|uniref:uroporphyrinogen-III synthase n=1 Tax=Asinibacterium sp. OR53 TaxID=925409 RepID=UPI0004B091D3|nr:uroporphyrinogen-III synthase [Asinibacterium sp. OR53]
MQPIRKTILSTRPVSAALVRAAQSKNIELEAISFIETEAIEDVEVQQEIEQAALQRAAIVFTSMNAVKAVTDMLDQQVPEWRIYCIGHKTQELVSDYFGAQSITATADHAMALADAIIEDSPEEVFFFCGNNRRDELPHQLQEHNIVVNEITVYQTRLLPHKVDKAYDAVVFFSPSAVDSFFKLNKLPEHTVVYAIGNTTKAAVKKYCSNPVKVGDSPDKEALIRKAIMSS